MLGAGKIGEAIIRGLLGSESRRADEIGASSRREERVEELREPYGEWAGLASVYMLAGYAKGIIPGRVVTAA